MNGNYMTHHSKQDSSNRLQKVLLFEPFEGRSSGSFYFSLKNILFIHFSFRGNQTHK